MMHLLKQSNNCHCRTHRYLFCFNLFVLFVKQIPQQQKHVIIISGCGPKNYLN